MTTELLEINMFTMFKCTMHIKSITDKQKPNNYKMPHVYVI